MDVFRRYTTLMIIGVLAGIAVFVSVVGVEINTVLEAIAPVFSSTRLTIAIAAIGSLPTIVVIVFGRRLETVRW